MAIEDTLVLRMVERGAAATAAGVGKVTAAVKGYAAATATASKRTLAMGRSTRYLGRDLMHNITLPILAVGGAAVKMNIDWQQAMTNVVTQTHYTESQVAGLNDQLLEMAKRSPKGPMQWAEALLHLAKIGIPAADVMKDLASANKAAVIGGAPLPAVAEAAGAAWLAGIKGGGDFAQTIREMTATVGTGNLSMEQLTQAMGTGVLPAAKVAGLGITDVFGALALLTDEGYRGSSAMAQMATAFHFLYAPTAKAEDALSGIGLSGTQLAEDMRKPRGLLTALTDLRNHLDLLPGGHKGVAASQTLGAILPGGRGRVLLTLLNQLDRYQMKMDQINTVQSTFEARFHKSMETPLNKMKTAWSSIQVDLIKVGGDLLPMVADGFSWTAKKIDQLLMSFHNTSPETRRWILIGVGLIAVLGPILTLVGLSVIAIGALMSPITLVVVGIAALAAGFLYAYNKSQLFHDAVDALWKVLGYVLPVAILIQHFQFLKDLIVSIPGAINTAFTASINFLISRINDVIWVINKALDAYNALPFAPNIGHVGTIPAIGATPARGGATSGHGPPPPPTSSAPRRRQGGQDFGFPQLIVPVTVMTPDGDVLGKAVAKANTRKRSIR